MSTETITQSTKKTDPSHGMEFEFGHPLSDDGSEVVQAEP